MPLETIYLIHHSHTDIGFTHEQPVCLDLHARFIDQAIEHCERTADYPDGSAMKWTCEVVLPVLHFLRTRPSRQIDRFAALAKAGRIEVAGMFAVMSQSPSLEATYRQFYWAEQLRRDLGIPVRTALQCDINGQNWGLVDALLDCGFDSFGMAINENVGRAAFQRQRPNGFYWQGPSGKQILTWNGLHYNANTYFGIPDDLERTAQDLPKFEEFLARRNYPYPFSLFQVTYNTFVDNGPVNPALPDFVRRWNELGRSTQLKIVTLSEFFDRLRQEPAQNLPVHRGDWTDYWNFGAASTAYETALNRQTYNRLGEAELALAFQDLQRARIRHKDLTDSWENTLLYDEHTWGANTSTVNPFGQAARSQLNHKLHYAYQSRSLAQVVRLEAIDDLSKSLNTNEKGLLIFNPLPWDRTDRVAFPQNWLTRNAAQTISHAQYLDRNEGSEQSGLIAASLLLSKPLQVPASGYRFYTFDQIKAKLPATPKGKGSLSAENRWLKITLDTQRGGLKRLYDKKRDKEWVDKKSAFSFGGYIHESIPASERKGKSYQGRTAIFRESDWSRFMAYGGWNSDWQGTHGGVSKLIETSRINLPGGVRLLQKFQAPGTYGVEYEITLMDDQPWVDLRVTIDKTWQTEPEALYLAFPLALKNGQPRYQTAGGVIRPHLDQLPSCNQDYHTAQEWVDFSDDKCGFTLTTIDAPIVMFGGFNLARMFDGPRESIPPLILSMVMTNYYHVNYAGGQLGRTQFHYRLYPHGKFSQAECNRVGREAAHPLICHPVYQPQGSRATSESWLKISEPGITVLAVKPSEDEQAVVVRLFNSMDKPCDATVAFPSHAPREVWACDQLERTAEKLPLENGTLTLNIPALSARSIRLA